eukprot:snap_masked-scaffold_11-processed-gene-3.30-mRNA-1 protein AED:1.00 eAED:1.00 QI:0/-1/0/0/-1/1/1/0/292
MKRYFLFFSLLVLSMTNEEQCESFGDLKMYHNITIPALGFGTAALPRDKYYDIIREAFESGFKHFDGAEAQEWYNNPMLSFSLRNILDRMPLHKFNRTNLFITTKIHPRNFHQPSIKGTMQKEFDLFSYYPYEYIDLVLLHFKQCYPHICNEEQQQKFIQKPNLWIEAYQQLEEYYEQGRVTSIGVSNFEYQDLKYILSNVGKGKLFKYKPHVVQNYPGSGRDLDAAVRKLCKENGVIYQAYSVFSRLINEPEVVKKNWSKEDLFSWAKENDVGLLIRSANLEHIRENSKYL